MLRVENKAIMLSVIKLNVVAHTLEWSTFTLLGSGLTRKHLDFRSKFERRTKLKIVINETNKSFKYETRLKNLS
jgi:hypothetical protein